MSWTPASGRMLWSGAAVLGVSAALAGCATPTAAPATASPGAASPGAPATVASTTASPAGGTVRDGTYSADGTYGSGPSTIGVRLTLVGGAIAAVQVTPHATNEVSLGYQQSFADAVGGVVVGRSIVGLQVDRLAGSSLTPDGFNAAVATILAEAER